MNIGIVTVHDSSNFGSYLQALGMQEVIKHNGDTPYFIKSRSKLTTLALFLGYNRSKSVRSVRNFLRFLRSAVKNPKDIQTGLKKYKTYKRDWSRYERVISIRQANRIGMDAVLFGSDELWNVNKPAFQNPALYGIGINAKRKSAYAISYGNATAEQIQKFPQLIDAVKKMDAIAVRDEYTRTLLETIGAKVDAKVCDPTIQADVRQYMRNDSEQKLPNEPCMVIYAYSVPKEVRDEITAYAKANHLKTVAVTLPQSWCDYYVNCSPLEFGSVLNKAKCVYTATFHGTIFSALYHTNFVVDSQLPKVIDVLNLLGLENRRLDTVSAEKLTEKDNEKIDYSEFENHLQEIRKASKKWYAYCVGGETNESM